MWRARFGRGFGLVARLLNERSNANTILNENSDIRASKAPLNLEF
jgi:hypothetical protein